MVRVFAPATSANLNAGFDKLGVALAPREGSPQEGSPLKGRLGDEVRVSEADDDSFAVTGPYAAEITGPNIAIRALERVRQLSGRSEPVSMELEKCMPVGSGLGSSAASVVAAVIACDEFYGAPLGPEARLALMGELEAELSGGVHWDNILPCVLGGLRLGAARLPVPAGWTWLVAYPGIRLETRMMRAVLPESVSLRDAVEQAARLGLLVDALHRGDSGAAAAQLIDPIVEPRRSPMIPGFDDVKAELLSAGAVAAGISGSGPTIFAIFDDAARADEGLSAARAWTGRVSASANGDATGSFARLCDIDASGARALAPGAKE